MKVNDVCCLPPVREGVEFWSNPPEQLRRYGELTGGGGFPEEVVDDPDAFVSLLDENDVDRVVIHGEDSESNMGAVIPNEPMAAFAEAYPDRIFPFSGFDPHKGRAAAEKLERAFTEHGMGGVVLQPMMSGLPADDPAYYPAYDACVEHDAIAWVHSSVHHAGHTGMYVTHPRHLDEVARAYPDLTVVAGHAGWPWVSDLVGLMVKYPNVYADISAWRPKYVAMAGTGWEPLVTYGNSLAQDQVLFGSNWPAFGALEDLLAEFEAILGEQLKPEVASKWLHENLEGLLSQ